jgi:thymidylate synthase
MENRYKNLNNSFYWVVSDILKKGMTVNSRGTEQKELCFYSTIIEDPTDILINYPSRKFNPSYAFTEWLWYLSQVKNTNNIGKLAKIWDMIKDENGECESNYGSYMFPIGQWDWVINELTNDPDSRRATIAINQPYHKKANSLDIPCTQYIQFFIRNGRLDMGVYMRSNDVIFGFCNDLFTFALFHQLMFNSLQARQGHPMDLQLGEYHHHAGSMHIYERHYEMAEKIMKDGADWYKKDLEKIKLKGEITSSYILGREYYLPRKELTKEQIQRATRNLAVAMLDFEIGECPIG